MVKNTDLYIATSHELARELLNKPDGFLSASEEDELGIENKYIIGSIKRTSTHANLDDSVVHWNLNLRKCKGGNVLR